LHADVLVELVYMHRLYLAAAKEVFGEKVKRPRIVVEDEKHDRIARHPAIWVMLSANDKVLAMAKQSGLTSVALLRMNLSREDEDEDDGADLFT
jgi:phage terminase small subunit